MRQLNVPHQLDILIEKMLSPDYTWQLDLDHYKDRKIISVKKGNDTGVYITFYSRGQVELGTYSKGMFRDKLKVVSKSALFDDQREAIRYVVEQFNVEVLRPYLE